MPVIQPTLHEQDARAYIKSCQWFKRRISRLPGAAGAAGLEGAHGPSRCQSHRGDHALTGDWILIFLLMTLSITPLRKLTGQLWLIRFRRMFGLFAFFYAVLHFLTYIWLDKFFDLHEIWRDVVKRRSSRWALPDSCC